MLTFVVAGENHDTATPSTTDSRQGLCIRVAVRKVLAEHHIHLRNYESARGFGEQLLTKCPPGFLLEDITTDWLRGYVEKIMQDNDELSNATINAKLSFVSIMLDHHKAALSKTNPLRAKPDVPWLPKKHVVKWWLARELEAKVCVWLRGNYLHDYADYVEWAARSGLRVEESLRVQRQHLDFEARTLCVPGTKTEKAQRVIPLYSDAFEIAARRMATKLDAHDYLFDFCPTTPSFEKRFRGLSATEREEKRMERNYIPLRKTWARVRDVFGLQSNPTATIKALRRSFAKVATDNGMPTAVLQQYLGHEHIETTMEYLKVVGGYNLDVMRRWVS